MLVTEAHLQIVLPLGLSFKQSIKDSPTGFLSCEIITTDHIIRGAYSVKKLCINVLNTAVIGNIDQIHIHGRAVGQRCPT